tara:strand:+ start:518 stop:670 length:153 start_codon:yes stop_codon:yes gene_type:complete
MDDGSLSGWVREVDFQNWESPHGERLRQDFADFEARKLEDKRFEEVDATP